MSRYRFELGAEDAKRIEALEKVEAALPSERREPGEYLGWVKAAQLFLVG